MLERELITIIVPTHNRSDVLPDALNSIKRQSYQNWEAIIVANNCTDGTETAVAPFLLDSRFTFINIPDAIGASNARNIGIENASGEFIAFLDDDDEWEWTKLERQAEVLRDNPDIGIVGCHYFQDGRDGAIKISFPCQIKLDDMLYSNYMGSFTFCMTRRNLLKGLKLEKKVESSEDWQFWLDIVLKSGMNMYIVPYPLARYDYSPDRTRLSFNMENKYVTYLRFVHIFWRYMKKSHKYYHLAVLKSKRSCVKKKFSWKELVRIAYFLFQTEKELGFNEIVGIIFHPFFCGENSWIKCLYHRLKSILNKK